ncbi:MAG: SRPBCC family protein [Pseudorhodobacter sp.]|nr:SRPBCC family protein [Rhizobacter sp.]
MEVKLDKRYPVAASIAQGWAVLSDMRATAACMPGAAITEQLDATHYKGTVKSKVGPAVMSFGGDIEVLALDAATHSMQMLGKGSDTSGSSASMNLAAHLEPGETPAACVLVGVATIMVNGKLAQFGSRLLVPVSDAMLAQFAGNFQSAAAAVPSLATHPTAAAEAATNGATASPSPSAATVAAPLTAQAPTHPRVPAPANELNALGLMWTVFKSWLAGLFGKRG